MKNTLILTILLLSFTGCSLKYKEVKVPTKCNIEQPKPPYTFQPVDEKYLEEVLIYNEKITSDLDFCINGLEKEDKK